MWAGPQPAAGLSARPASATLTLMHPISRRHFLLSASALAAPGRLVPYGPAPSPRQLRWHDLETHALVHFGLNTFTDKEWGDGSEDPALFNPSAFDAGAIVEGIKAGGLRGLILTAKHHDGFCLWPTATTEYSVRRSPWRGGKGDVVRELSEAARRHGLLFGIYLSPWDRNNAQYGSPEYIATYRAQLRELLTNYGPIYEVFHDGANGGTGYYGGAREKRLIDKRAYYDWPRTWELVRSLQPGAVIFTDIGPDVRWVGNESGEAGETCWAAYAPVGENGGPAAVGDVRTKDAATGHRDAPAWIPAECDVSIRPGWFWHESENARVKTPAELMDLYFKSAGRGANLLLNVPPDRRGLLHEADLASLRTFGRMVRDTFGHGIAAARQGKLTIDLPRPATFDIIRLREDIRLGQRVDSFAIDAWNSEAWSSIAEGTSIGPRRILRLPTPVTAARLRLRITKSAATPVLTEFALYATPENLVSQAALPPQM
jgi:alpha-L-fucosidase